MLRIESCNTHKCSGHSAIIVIPFIHTIIVIPFIHTIIVTPFIHTTFHSYNYSIAGKMGIIESCKTAQKEMVD
jgi:hypothetical protein